MLLPPPRSTLFPYTTLFRSLHELLHLPQGVPWRPLGIAPEQVQELLLPRHRAGRVRGRRPRGDAEDRKSTRLNSSHEWISYAVFCLKKKKKTNQAQNQNQRA